MLLSCFKKRFFQPPRTAKPADLPKKVVEHFYVPKSIKLLLEPQRRSKLLEHIWQRTSVSRAQFELLYLNPIHQYAQLVQELPASESHHHAYAGGMLDHGLEIIAYALKLRQSYLLPVGSSPETQAAQSDAWTACVAYAAMLHDVGKIAVDIEVQKKDGQIWHPWNGPLTLPYRFAYKKDREYQLHSAATGLLYTQILSRPILDWLSSYPELWSAFLFVMSGQYEHAGILGEIVIKADQASVAQELGGDPVKALAAPKNALQRKLLDGLRHLLKESLKLNQPQASDGWLTEDSLWLVSKTVLDKLRAHLLSQGADGIPSSNTAIFDVLQEHGIVQSSPDGKAIWSATVTGSNGWSHSFTFLKVAPALIWQQASDRPEVFDGMVTPQLPATTAKPGCENPSPATTSPLHPQSASMSGNQAENPKIEHDSDLDIVFDLLGDTAPAIPENVPNDEPHVNVPACNVSAQQTQTTQANSSRTVSEPLRLDTAPSGAHFCHWLQDSILNKKIIMNEPRALVHSVADTLFLVSPGIFSRYAQEFPNVNELAKAEQVQNWRWIQKQFEKMKVHKKQPDGLNIWTCMVTGPRKSRRVYGYLLDNPQTILHDLSFNNPYIELVIKNEGDS